MTTDQISAENKRLTSKVKRLNKKLAECYKSIADLIEESNALIIDMKEQRNESDKEIDRLMGVIESKGLCAESN